MRVSKYQGCGNDFLITMNDHYMETTMQQMSKALCNRHFGIGADGCIFVDSKPLRMYFFNCDGTKANMCGNGLRCLIHYAYDQQMLEKTCNEVITDAGVFVTRIENKSDFYVEIQMGTVKFVRSFFVDQQPIALFHIGVYHAVVYVDSFACETLEKLAKNIQAICKIPVNINFVKILTMHHLQVYTYEHGVGFTNACGSGSCACAYAVWLQQKQSKPFTIELKYSTLQVYFDTQHICYLRGPSTCIFQNLDITPTFEESMENFESINHTP